MPLLKGATKKLREAGIEHIEVRRGLWGLYLYDPRLKKQRIVRCANWREAVQAAIHGERPTDVDDGKEE